MEKHVIQCPYCESQFRVEESYEGKRGKCPECGETFAVNFSRNEEADLQELAAGFQDPVINRNRAAKKQPAKATSEKRSSINRSFPVLKFFAIAYGILGGLMTTCGAILLLFRLANLVSFLNSPGTTELLISVIIFGGGLLFAREMTMLHLAIEENTRASKDVLKRLAQE